MAMIRCARRLQWCMGHRLVGHESKCAHLHGHNYVGLFEATTVDPGARGEGAAAGAGIVGSEPARVLDSVGRVIDFSVLKARIGGWIEREWDHGFLVNQEDGPAISGLQAFVAAMTVEAMKTDAGREVLRDNKHWPWQKVAELPYNPTAENIARYLGEVVCPEVLHGTGVRVVRVKVWETENCFAVWEAAPEFSA